MIPIVSIIIPSFNKEKYISDSINSVLKQSYTNWELIIIDDLSNDNTVEIISEFLKKDSRIRFYSNSENKGANYSRNFGIKEAKGEFVIFLDADDLFSPNCLRERIKYIENTNLDFCVFTLEVFKNNIGDTKQLWKPNTKQPVIDFLSHNLPWQTMQPIWSKKFLMQLGGFNEQFSRLQDVELHTRALFSSSVKYKLINNTPDCFYRVDEERKNFTNVLFLGRWVDSALLYYHTFYDSAKAKGLESYLMGTIYKTYLQILYFYKSGRINENEFQILKSKLFNTAILENINIVKRCFFSFSGFYNLLPFRIPGVNYLISKFLVI